MRGSAFHGLVLLRPEYHDNVSASDVSATLVSVLDSGDDREFSLGSDAIGIPVQDFRRAHSTYNTAGAIPYLVVAVVTEINGTEVGFIDNEFMRESYPFNVLALNHYCQGGTCETSLVGVSDGSITLSTWTDKNFEARSADSYDVEGTAARPASVWIQPGAVDPYVIFYTQELDTQIQLKSNNDAMNTLLRALPYASAVVCGFPPQPTVGRGTKY